MDRRAHAASSLLIVAAAGCVLPDLQAGAPAGTTSSSGVGGAGGSSSGAAGSGAVELGSCPMAVPDLDVNQALPIPMAAPSFGDGGTVLHVAAGEDLQATIDLAAAGDTVELQAGAEFAGPITLPSKGGTGWITVRTSDVDALPEGRRVTTADAVHMARITAPDGDAAITVLDGAQRYRMIGLEVTPANGTSQTPVLLRIGDAPPGAAGDIPQDMWLERSYIHGASGVAVTSGIITHANRTSITDSYVAGLDAGTLTKAIVITATFGPVRVVNNTLDATETTLAVDAYHAGVGDMIPADIEIRDNYFARDASVATANSSFVSISSVQKALVACNVFSDNGGGAEAFELVAQSSSVAVPKIEDVTFAHNTLANGFRGLRIDGGTSGGSVARVVFEDHFFGELQSWVAFVGGNSGVVKIDHLTAPHTLEAAFLGGGLQNATLLFDNSVVSLGTFAANGLQDGFPSLDGTLGSDGYTIAGNVLVGAAMSRYPANNGFPASLDGVGFVDYHSSDWSLSPTSPFVGLGTDGKAPGADFDTLKMSLAGVGP